MTPECISYPKSGRSWLRFMLQSAGVGEAVNFQHDGFEFNDPARPAHSFDVGARLQRYPVGRKIIYLERDPRDVMVSLYHQITGRFADFFDYDGTIGEFIRDDYFGAHVLKKYRAMWTEVLKKRDFLHLTYEGLHHDAAGALRSVVTYLDLRVDEAHIIEAVEAASFDNMKDLERRGAHDEPWLRLRNGASKVREGKVGSHKQLSGEDIAFLNSIFGLRSI